MKMKKVVLQLSPEEVVRFIRIMTDEDKDDALSFLKEVMKPRIDDATRNHRVPVFEAIYKPHQRDPFMWRKS